MGKLKYIEWTEACSVGDPVLDAQHQQVFRIINELWDARNEGLVNMRSILERLSLYTETHFACEEAYMKCAKYPQRKEHCQYHQYMASETNKHIDALYRGVIDTDELLVFLKNWWQTHIMTRDMDYVPCVKRMHL